MFHWVFSLLTSSNCVVNLSPDKRTVLREAYRVLKVLQQQVVCILNRFVMAMGTHWKRRIFLWKYLMCPGILANGKCAKVPSSHSTLETEVLVKLSTYNRTCQGGISAETVHVWDVALQCATARFCLYKQSVDDGWLFLQGESLGCLQRPWLISLSGWTVLVLKTQHIHSKQFSCQQTAAGTDTATSTNQFPWLKPSQSSPSSVLKNLCRDSFVCLLLKKAPIIFFQAGGELYFSDVYASRDLSEDIRKHKVLWGKWLPPPLPNSGTGGDNYEL